MRYNDIKKKNEAENPMGFSVDRPDLNIDNSEKQKRPDNKVVRMAKSIANGTAKTFGVSGWSREKILKNLF